MTVHVNDGRQAETTYLLTTTRGAWWLGATQWTRLLAFYGSRRAAHAEQIMCECPVHIQTALT